MLSDAAKFMVEGEAREIGCETPTAVETAAPNVKVVALIVTGPLVAIVPAEEVVTVCGDKILSPPDPITSGACMVAVPFV